MRNQLLFLLSLMLGRVGVASELPNWTALSPAQQKQWFRILHSSHGHSTVVTPTFFVSANGAENLANEFEESVHALDQQTPFTPENEDFQCRFPWRTQWIAENLHRTWAVHACPQLSAWQNQLASVRIDLIFASSFLGNPASGFGHTLLKFVRRGPLGKPRHDLLSYGVSYGANVTSNGALSYAFSGTFGYFLGQFSVAPYYEKLREYNFIDNRDLWVFELNLNPAEIRHAVDHLWEMHEAQLRYYFFTRNCSYQLMTFLEAIRPDINLSDHFSLWVLPIDTLRAIHRANLIQTFNLRPSREKAILLEWENLSPQEQVQVLKADHQRRLDGDEDRATLNTLIDLNLVRINHNTSDPALKEFHNALLSARQKFPTAPESANVLHPPSGPHQFSTARALFAGTVLDGDQAFASIGARAVAKNWLESQVELERLSELILGDFRLRSGPGHLRLDKADLVRLSSFAPSRPLFSHTASRLHIGGQERPTWSCERCFVTQISAEVGKAWRLNDPFIGFTLIGTRGETQDLQMNRVDAGLLTSAGLIFAPNSRLAVSLEGGPTYMVNRYGGVEIRSQWNFKLNDQWMFLGTVEHATYLQQEIRQAHLEMGYRF